MFPNILFVINSVAIKYFSTYIYEQLDACASLKMVFLPK